MAPGINFDSTYPRVFIKTGGEYNELGKYVEQYDAVDAIRYAVNDLTTTEKYDTRVKGLYENEEEKDMNKVVELYVKRKKEKINEKYNKMVEKDYNELELVKQYKEAVKEFEIKMEELYNNELNCGESTIVERHSDNDFKYALNGNIKNTLLDFYSEEREAEYKELNDLIEEVNAQLSLSDDLDYQKDILVKYDIIDKKTGKIN